jgi:hypothetical protein
MACLRPWVSEPPARQLDIDRAAGPQQLNPEFRTVHESKNVPDIFGRTGKTMFPFSRPDGISGPNPIPIIATCLKQMPASPARS